MIKNHGLFYIQEFHRNMQQRNFFLCHKGPKAQSVTKAIKSQRKIWKKSQQ